MNTFMENIVKALEISLVKQISKGEAIKFDYTNKIDGTPLLREAYKMIDIEKLKIEIEEQLRHEIAKKLVNKMITEMGNDIKSMMCSQSVREDFKYMLRSNVEKIMDAVKAGEE